MEKKNINETIDLLSGYDLLDVCDNFDIAIKHISQIRDIARRSLEGSASFYKRSARLRLRIAIKNISCAMTHLELMVDELN